MRSRRGTLIYTLFATAVFIALQVFSGERDLGVLAVMGAMFLVFTYFMMRLINQVMDIVLRGRTPQARAKRTAERGPAVVEATSDRIEHNRRRRERRRRR